MKKIAIKLVNISKTFGGIQAVADANLEIEEGTIHVLMGENGAGKSTLAKIISGFHEPQSGQIYVYGELQKFLSPADAYSKGICMVYQATTLCPDLSIRDNLMLGSEVSMKLDPKYETDLIKEKLRFLGIDFKLPPLETKVQKLSTAERKMVDICRGLTKNSKIFVLDEPTSSIGLRETNTLLKTLEQMRDNREYTIIFITHKMKEAAQIADYITVMRNGRIINTYSKGQFQEELLLKDMVGNNFQKENKNVVRIAHKVYDDKPVLKVVNVSGKVGKTQINNVSFELHKGEVLGFAGLIGAGRSELFSLILGISKKDNGKIFFDGEEIKNPNPSLAIRKGYVYLSEEREKNGFADFTVLRNISMPLLGLKSSDDLVSRFGIIRRKREKILVEKLISDFGIVGKPHSVLSSLSGGNQQKVFLAKLLALNPKVIIFDDPTIGIDIPTKEYLYSLIDSLVNSGKGVILISSDNDEIARISDRIVLFKNGTIKDILETHSKAAILDSLLLS